MKKVLLPLLGTILFLIAVSFVVKGNKLANIGSSPAPVSLKEIKIGDTPVKVEVADTPEKRNLGLGKRSSLAPDGGMLFVFERKQTFANFWMKDMNFPLDFIWISNGKVIKIDKNAPAQPGVADSQLKIYSPGEPIDYVLEVNAGFAEKNNITIGQTLSGL